MKIFHLSLAAACVLMIAPVAFAGTPVPPGTVEVGATSLPLAGSIPRGAQRYPLMTLALRTPCDAPVTLTSLTLQHRGLGDARDFDGVYAWVGDQRVTRSFVPQKDGAVTVRFRNYVLPACGETVVTILVSISPDAALGGEHLLEFKGGTAADASVRFVAVASGTPSPAATVPQRVQPGTIDVEYLSITGSQSYGANRVLQRLRLVARSRGDQQVTAIRFTNQGSARDTDLRSLYLRGSDGTPLSAKADRMDGDTVRLTLDPPLTLQGNDVRVLELRGDIRASRKKTIRWTIEEASDIESRTCAGTRECLQAH